MKSFLTAVFYSIALTIVVLFFGGIWAGNLHISEWGWLIRMICAFIWLVGILFIFLDYQSKL